MLRAFRRLGVGSKCPLCGDLATRKILQKTSIDDLLDSYQSSGCLLCLLLWAGTIAFVDGTDTGLLSRALTFDIVRGDKNDLLFCPIAPKSDFPDSANFPIQFYLPSGNVTIICRISYALSVEKSNEDTV